jgi:hypothetical protein
MLPHTEQILIRQLIHNHGSLWKVSIVQLQKLINLWLLHVGLIERLWQARSKILASLSYALQSNLVLLFLGQTPESLIEDILFGSLDDNLSLQRCLDLGQLGARILLLELLASVVS